MDHQQGQYRAELFDEFLYKLLQRVYPERHVLRGVVAVQDDQGATVPANIDFVVTGGDKDIVIETKAPYTSSEAHAINRGLKHLQQIVSETLRQRLGKAVFATPGEIPAGARKQIEQTRGSIEKLGREFEVWDAQTLRALAERHLGTTLTTFSVDELEQLVGLESKSSAGASAEQANVQQSLPVGRRDDVVVLSTDFCSFSRFVHASGDDTELITSVMGRFYRETRAAVAEYAGLLDKYMGDGILCYWFGADAAVKMEACVQRLVAIAINLAEEWQDQVDLAVLPKGLRSGAALGAVLFIPEKGEDGPVHAIGESINIAARLQSAAAPNALVISNRLRSRYFGARDDFQDLGTLALKNIGDVIAWQKTYGVAGGGA